MHKRNRQPKDEDKVVSSKMQKIGVEERGVRPNVNDKPRPSRTSINQINLSTHKGLKSRGKTSDNEGDECKLVFCPNCQVPFSALTKDKNVKNCDVQQLHLNDCLDMDRRYLKECPQGISCGSTIPSHFYNFSHFQKAAKNVTFMKSGLEPEKTSGTLPYDIRNETDVTGTGISQASDKLYENSKSGLIFEESESRPIPSLLRKETDCRPTDPEPKLCNNGQVDVGTYLLHHNLALETIPVPVCEVVQRGKASSAAPIASDPRKMMSHEMQSKDLMNVSPKTKLQTKLTSFFLGANGKKPTRLEFTSSECNRKPSQVKSSSLKIKLAVEKTASSDDHLAQSNKGARTCPFYKKILGTKFAVDAFSYGSIPDVRHYFLSHFHSDHYQGLNKYFAYPLYCTKVTANLIALKIGVSQKYLFICPEDEPFIVDGVTIQLLNANHCPGSVMFLFSFLDGQNILHTGDFRATTNMKTDPLLSDVHTLYLDTTYLDARYSFPSQDAVITYVTGLVEKTLRRNPRTLFVCGSYTIGKERLFMAISKKSNLKIWASSTKQRILRCLEDDFLNANLITNWKQAQIHVLSMNLLNSKDLLNHLSHFEGIYTELVAIKPTGWTYQRSTANLAEIKPQNSGSVAMYSVPYSEHSSFLELKEFVQTLRPKKIIPTVKSKSGFSEMNVILKDWLKM